LGSCACAAGAWRGARLWREKLGNWREPAARGFCFASGRLRPALLDGWDQSDTDVPMHKSDVAPYYWGEEEKMNSLFLIGKVRSVP